MKIKLIFVLIFVQTIVLTVFSQQKNLEITYIANAGFLIESNHKKVLIDALINSGYNNYLTPSDTVELTIEKGIKSFSNANLLLFTHNHADHFDVQKVVKYLGSKSENIIIAPSLVINSIKNKKDISFSDNQLVEIPDYDQYGIDTTIQGIKIKSFFLQHDNRINIQNVGYLIEIEGIKVFHTGDNIGFNKNEYEKMKLQNKSIDLAILNFYGFWESKEQRDFTKKNINPKNIVLMHIPPKEIETVKDSCKKINDFFDISIFDKSMDKKIFIYDQQ